MARYAMCASQMFPNRGWRIYGGGGGWSGRAWIPAGVYPSRGRVTDPPLREPVEAAIGACPDLAPTVP